MYIVCALGISLVAEILKRIEAAERAKAQMRLAKKNNVESITAVHIADYDTFVDSLNPAQQQAIVLGGEIHAGR